MWQCPSPGIWGRTPPRLDGVVYVAIAMRRAAGGRSVTKLARRLQCRRGDSRFVRQRWVVEQVLSLLGNELEVGL